MENDAEFDHEPDEDWDCDHLCPDCGQPCGCMDVLCSCCEPDDPEGDFDWNDYDDVGAHREG